MTSSLAGRVRNPKLPVGECRIGGFGGPDGFADYLETERITAVIDATHPFAATMTRTAATVCAALAIPRLVVQRPRYSQQPHDEWLRVPSVAAAAQAIPQCGRRVFITTGRQELPAYAQLPAETYSLVRCVDPPVGAMPPNLAVILARGPFDVAAERKLLHTHRIEVLTTKDSGGSLTSGKLQAARELGITVIMVDRPTLPSGDVVSTAQAAQAWVAAGFVT